MQSGKMFRLILPLSFPLMIFSSQFFTASQDVNDLCAEKKRYERTSNQNSRHQTVTEGIQIVGSPASLFAGLSVSLLST